MIGSSDLQETEIDLRAEAAQKERRHIANEVHDALGLLHTGVLLQGESLVREVDSLGHPNLTAQLERMLDAAHLAHRQLSAVLEEGNGLDMLARGGLLTALDHYAHRVAPTTVTITGSLETRLAEDVERALYGIAIAAISNSLRYAGLDEIPDGVINVLVTIEQGQVRLCVCDNGRGFDLSNVTESGETQGLDLMRQMALSAGGAVVVTSAPQGGTEVCVTVPIERHHGQTSQSANCG